MTYQIPYYDKSFFSTGPLLKTDTNEAIFL